MADVSASVVKVKRIARGVKKVPTEKRAEFAKAKNFDLEKAFLETQELKEQALLLGDIKAAATIQGLILKLMGFMTERFEIEVGPNIIAAEMAAAAARQIPGREPIDFITGPDGGSTIDVTPAPEDVFD